MARPPSKCEETTFRGGIPGSILSILELMRFPADIKIVDVADLAQPVERRFRKA